MIVINTLVLIVFVIVVVENVTVFVHLEGYLGLNCRLNIVTVLFLITFRIVLTR